MFQVSFGYPYPESLLQYRILDEGDLVLGMTLGRVSTLT